MQKFTKEVATREASRARILLDGAAGSGKTFTALLFAKVLGKSTLLFDSENKSSTKYSDRFQFNVVKLTDFSPKNYTDAIKYGQQETEEVLVIDSISHAWAGEGGALELAETSKVKTGGNKWAAWSLVTPDLNSLTNAILQCEKHLICTARVKTDWELSEEGGKKKYNKVGLATVARQEFDYEFDLHFRMIAEGTEHYLHVLKSRYSEIKVGELIKNPDEAFAERLAKVISTGISPEDAEKIKALAYYEKLAAQAVALKIKFNHHTEASDIETIKADGKKLRDEITAAEAKQAKPTAAKPEPGASPEAAPAIHPDATPEAAPASSPKAAPLPGYLDSELMEDDAVDDLPRELFEDNETPAPTTKSGFSQPLFAGPLRGAPMPAAKRKATSAKEHAPTPARSLPQAVPATTADLRTALSHARSIEDLETIADTMGKQVVFKARLKQVLTSENVGSISEIRPSRMTTIVGALAGYLVDQLPKMRK